MIRRLVVPAAAIVLTACGDLFAPRQTLPSGIVPANAAQAAALRTAFDSVGRCMGAARATLGRPPVPSFYIVAGVDSFVAINGSWAGGEYVPRQDAIAIAEHQMSLRDTLPGRPETAFFFRLWMHEAMHAYVYYYTGETGHPAAWFGPQGPCGTLNPWWDGAWSPSPTTP